MPEGNLAWTYMIDSPFGRFALFVGQVEEAGRAFPFEVWVNGAEQPRGLGAVAKTLSMDMRADDRAWLQMKLDVAREHRGRRRFEMRFPPHGEKRKVPGVVSAMAQVVRWRCEQLKASTARRARRCSTTCSASTSRAPAPTARCRGPWTS
jgi:ribonucleoside-diphosphate reductase alpha chain